MIICSCNVLTSAGIRAAAEKLRDEEPTRPVTPGRVFLALGARPQCGSCVELVRQSLREWGFPLTCPEPLSTIADEEEATEEDDEAIEWGLV